MSSAECKEKELAAAALALLQDYKEDKDLIAFTILDAEEFHG